MNKNDNIKIVLKDIVSKYGIEVLNDNIKISAFMMDLFPNQKKEKEILKKILGNNVHKIIIGADKKSNLQKEKALKDAKDKIINDLWISEEAADFFIDCMTFILGWRNFISHTSNITAPTPPQNIINSQNTVNIQNVANDQSTTNNQNALNTQGNINTQNIIDNNKNNKCIKISNNFILKKSYIWGLAAIIALLSIVLTINSNKKENEQLFTESNKTHNNEISHINQNKTATSFTDTITSFVSNFKSSKEYLRSVEDLNANVMELYETNYNDIDKFKIILYYVFPTYYDFLSAIENMTLEQYKQIVLKNGLLKSYSEDLMNMEINKIGDVEFSQGKNNLLEGIKNNLLNDSKHFYQNENVHNLVTLESELIKDRILSNEELQQINNFFTQNPPKLNSVVMEVLENDLGNYEAEKGYLCTFKKNNEEKTIKIYYMNGQWRIFWEEFLNGTL